MGSSHRELRPEFHSVEARVCASLLVKKMDLLSRTRRLSAPPGPPPTLPKTAGCGGFESSPSFSTSSSNMPPRVGAPQPSVGFGNSGRSSGASVNSPRPRQDTLPPKIASLCEWFEEACSVGQKDAEAYSWFFVDKGYDEPDHLMGIADDSAWPPGIKAAHKAKIIEVANAMLETDPNGGAPDPLASMPADPAVAAERRERASKEYEEAQAEAAEAAAARAARCRSTHDDASRDFEIEAAPSAAAPAAAPAAAAPAPAKRASVGAEEAKKRDSMADLRAQAEAWAAANPPKAPAAAPAAAEPRRRRRRCWRRWRRTRRRPTCVRRRM